MLATCRNTYENKTGARQWPSLERALLGAALVLGTLALGTLVLGTLALALAALALAALALGAVAVGAVGALTLTLRLGVALGRALGLARGVGLARSLVLVVGDKLLQTTICCVLCRPRHLERQERRGLKGADTMISAC